MGRRWPYTRAIRGPCHGPEMVHVWQERHHLAPELYPAIIHITIGVTNHLCIRAKLKAVQHDPAGLGHDAFRFGNRAVDVVDRGFDQQGGPE